MSIKDFKFGDGVDRFNVVVEIAKDSQDKYEYDEKLDTIKLDRVLYGSQRYPFNYGFVPETRAEDGDHADVVLLSTNPLVPGVLVEARAIGFMEMIDNGERDNKIIAVPLVDPRFADILSLDDLPQHTTKEIQNFFETYKLLENKKVEIKGFGDKEHALQELQQTAQAYQKEQGK